MSSSIHVEKPAGDQTASLSAPRSPYLRRMSAARVTGRQIRLGLEGELVRHCDSVGVNEFRNWRHPQPARV